MGDAIEQFAQSVWAYVPQLLGALAILILGWLVALVVATGVRNLLRRAELDNRIAKWLRGEEEAEAADVERWVSKGVFCLIMLFVLVAFFQTLGLTLITEPLNSLLVQVLNFVPRLLGAGLLLLLAWMVASVLRVLVSRGLTAARLDERLGSQVGVPEEQQIPLSKSVADATYWLVFLLFLPAILGALALEGLLEPVQVMIGKILDFLPNLFTAALILGLGWFLARIVQRIVTNLLSAIGADRLSENLGMASTLGEKRLSGAGGLIVHILILIPVLLAALNALQLEAVTVPVSSMLTLIVEAIPSIFAACLVLAIAYVVGRLVSGLVANLLTGVGFNNILLRLGLAKETAEGKQTPSAIVGTLVLFAFMLFAIIEACRLLGFAALADLLVVFAIFAGHVILGLVIFAIGLYLAGLASRVILASGATQAGLLALAARVCIIVVAGAMALRQMGLANEIINLAFGLLLGAVAVAVAIAFGIGGREIAGRQLEQWLKAVKTDKP
ncbi:hypothetical protein AMJ85_00500 [candidate division BRC1 bacterium SM23_51]|nr:MAG: hypothetical protein AMJ85_00500 [candidate division BRC1 bacterium SM23_51]